MSEKMICGQRIDSPVFKLGGEEDFWRADNTCSYCGSLHPDVFLDFVAQGTLVTPTDKNYKAYLASNKKFYFQHLSVAQKARFLQLYNDGIMQLDYPGYFYADPYFCKREPVSDSA